MGEVVSKNEEGGRKEGENIAKTAGRRNFGPVRRNRQKLKKESGDCLWGLFFLAVGQETKKSGKGFRRVRPGTTSRRENKAATTVGTAKSMRKKEIQSAYGKKTQTRPR